MAKYEAVIGLEIHLQLNTKTKLFCASKNGESIEPNVHVCPICMGHPGVLPVLNQEAVRKAGILALALDANVMSQSVFARKNYFYPDLPKGYQISQYELPFATGGQMQIETEDLKRHTITFERLHLEEDAAKSIHSADGKTLVDFNRAGVPLVEMVTRPDFRTSEQARLFLQQLQQIVRYCGVSDADMEKGQMRCDANISVRPVGDAKLYPKTEVKNMNSIRAVERALAFELERQLMLWEERTPPSSQSTRGWNDATGETFEMRLKEAAADYRYFVEPDLPPLVVTQEMVNTWRAQVPELPVARASRFVDEYALSKHDAGILTADVKLSDFYESVMSELREWVTSLEHEADEETIWNMHRKKLARMAFSWMTSDLFKLLNNQGKDFSAVRITPENFSEFLTLIHEQKINRTGAAIVLEKMLERQDFPGGSDPTPIVTELKLEQLSDQKTLSQVVDAVIQSNEQVVRDYRQGRTNALMVLVGKVMKETKGTANPTVVTDLLKQRLG